MKILKSAIFALALLSPLANAEIKFHFIHNKLPGQTYYATYYMETIISAKKLNGAHSADTCRANSLCQLPLGSDSWDSVWYTPIFASDPTGMYRVEAECKYWHWGSIYMGSTKMAQYITLTHDNTTININVTCPMTQGASENEWDMQTPIIRYSEPTTPFLGK